MQYGHFDNARREYVIDRIDLPVSWTNYIGIGDMYGDRIIYGEAQAYKLPMLKMEGSIPARLSVHAQDLL